MSCNNDSKEPTDTPTSGTTTIEADEAFKPLLQNQAYTFEALYPNATINLQFTPEADAIQHLFDDSCKVIVTGRMLSNNEKKHFESKNIFPITTKIAEDALAILLSKQNRDSILTIKQLQSLLADANTNIKIVLDNSHSANTNYCKDSLLAGKAFSKNVFALQSSREVIDYVGKNVNSMGIIGVNWMSDTDDSLTTHILNKVTVAAIAKDSLSIAVKPYQAYIKTKEYPLTRNIYMINRQTRAGLGMGFVSFVAGEKGQLMILKSGMVPAIAPVRLVEIKN